MPKLQGSMSATTSAQNTNASSGTPTANSTSTLQLDGDVETLGIQVVGSYTGTLSVQVSVDGSNWVTLAASTAVTNVGAGTTSATIPANTVGVFRADVRGMKAARVTSLAAITGTPVVTLIAT